LEAAAAYRRRPPGSKSTFIFNIFEIWGLNEQLKSRRFYKSKRR
jgi:hypothetical protein